MDTDNNVEKARGGGSGAEGVNEEKRGDIYNTCDNKDKLKNKVMLSKSLFKDMTITF